MSRSNRTAQEDAEILSTIAMLFETLARKEPSEAALEGYRLALSDLTPGQIKLAGIRALSQCQFMPAPVELRKLAGEKGSDTKALEAWTAVLKAVSDLGPYKHVDFDDHLCNAAIRSMGDWPTFCGRFEVVEGEKSQLQWVKKEFLAAYEAMSGVPAGSEAALCLPGLSTSYEWQDGRKYTPEVIKIGCKSAVPMIEAKQHAIEDQRGPQGGV